MKGYIDSMFFKKLWDALYSNKGKIELIAAIITIIAVIGGFVLRMNSYRNNVSVTETIDTLYESDVIVLDGRSYQNPDPEPDYVKRIIFDIVNNNDKPLYFNSDDAVTIEVLGFDPYPPEAVLSNDSFIYPWIDPVIWRATIDGHLPTYYREASGSKPSEFAARPIIKSDSDFSGKEYLRVDSEELTRFIVEIDPVFEGEYIIRIKIKYKYKHKSITYESKTYKRTLGYGKDSIIEYNP